MEIIFRANDGANISPLVPLVMIAWLPIVIYIFSRFPAHRALMISLLTAWLFLPEASIVIPGLPDYTKITATCYGIFIATVLFDVQRFNTFKFSWLDIPILIFCISPFFSSMSNGLGWYDGVSESLGQTISWGLPYFLGRLYLNKLVPIKEYAIGIFAGGLLYVPLCLFEIRMSPQLHRIVYGDFAHGGFSQTMRYGGWRPAVFMQHGLAVGVWMMSATLLGIWLWQSGVLKRFWGLPMLFLVPTLLATFILVKSTGAYFLLISGLVILWAARFLGTSVPLLALMLSVLIYLGQNSLTGTYITDQAVQLMSGIVPQERIDSLQFRFDNEELLADKARERIVFGWGGWGRNRVYDERGQDVSTTDSFWIIELGKHGLVGLTSWVLAFFLPVVAFINRYPASWWGHPKIAPAAGMAVLVVLYVVDCLANAMLNPIFIVACGGLAGLVLQPIKQVRQKRQGLPHADPIVNHLSRSSQNLGT